MTTPKFIRRLYWWSFGLRAVAGLVTYVLTLYFEVPLLLDALHYEEMGARVANDWLDGQSSDWLDEALGTGREAWLTIVGIAAIYYVTQGIRMVPVLLVLYSAATAAITVYIFRITLELGAPEAAAKRAAWLVTLSPAFIFWSGTLYKEGMIFLVLCLIVYHTLRLQAGWRASSMVIVALSLFALLGLRFYLAILAGMVVMLGLLWMRRGQDAAAIRRAGPFAFARQLLVAGGFAVLMVTLGFVERAERPVVETQQGILVQLDASRRDLAASAYSGYFGEMQAQTPEEVVQFLPVALVYFLTVPHPWDIGGYRQNMTIPETLFWIMLYPLIIVGARQGLRANRSGTMLVLAMTVGMCLIYALICGNVGTAYRMRSQVWLLWAPFAGWGITVWRERRAQRRLARSERRKASFYVRA